MGGNLNLTGVSTVGFLTAQNVTVGIITANSFVGDGSGLTGLTVLTLLKHSFKLIYRDRYLINGKTQS